MNAYRHIFQCYMASVILDIVFMIEKLDPSKHVLYKYEFYFSIVMSRSKRLHQVS